MPEDIDENPGGEHFKVDRGKDETSEANIEQPTPQAFTEKIDAALAEPVTPESGLADKPDGGEWDPELVKAQTIAEVVRSDEKYKEASDKIDFLNNPEAVRRVRDEHDAANDKLREVNERVYAADNMPGSEEVWGLRRELAAEREQAIDDFNGLRWIEDRGHESQEAQIGIKYALERAYNMHEELFDTNPERFGNMPTTEFIGIAKELKTLRYGAELTSSYTDRLEGETERVKGFLEASQVVDTAKLIKSIGETLEYTTESIDDKKLEGVIGEYHALQQGELLDMTPRQIYDKLVEVLTAANKLVAEKSSEMKTQADELLAKQKAPEQEAE